MTDQEMWQEAVAQLRIEFERLPAVILELLRVDAERIRRLKEAIHAFAVEADGAATCARCGGQCCLRGKFHVTVIDLLVFLVTGQELFTPRFDRDHCPYLGDAGCYMAPAFRPFNCITFNCERIEELWEPREVARFYRLEQELRRCYEELEALLGNRFMGGVLLNFQRDVLAEGGSFLRVEE